MFLGKRSLPSAKLYVGVSFGAIGTTWKSGSDWSCMPVFDIVSILPSHRGLLAWQARARGMTQLARDTGLGRESLYKALNEGAKPRYDTILKVVRVLVSSYTPNPRMST